MIKKFILVTDWDNHWKGKHNASYPSYMLKNDLTYNSIKKSESSNEVIFVKTSKSNKRVEKVWIGFVDNLKLESKGAVTFDVHIKEELEGIEKYKDYTKSGWYHSSDLNLADNKIDENKNAFTLPLFERMRVCKQWKDFENDVFLLLKSIGLNQVYKIEKQTGKADGFFYIRNLSVIYDATLRTSFEKEKEQQIKNCIGELKCEKIKLENNTEFTIQKEKQVWIITRGVTRKIIKSDGIKVLEVSIKTLIDIYYKRLTNDKFDEERLEETLRTLVRW